jgi:hypothetical protein
VGGGPVPVDWAAATPIDLSPLDLEAAPVQGAALFGLLIIGVDRVLTHPADMNVPFPASLLFYPVISLMAEILFRLMPLAALVTAISAFGRHGPPESAVWASLFVVSLLEPSFQVLAAVSERPVVGRRSLSLRCSRRRK